MFHNLLKSSRGSPYSFMKKCFCVPLYLLFNSAVLGKFIVGDCNPVYGLIATSGFFFFLGGGGGRGIAGKV